MRILITGPECTGKSTLSHQLGTKLGIPVLSEYARNYLSEHGPDYDEADLRRIATGHIAQVITFPLEQPIILDTYLYNLKIWSEVKYGSCNQIITDALAAQYRYDHIFLMYPDLIWKQDGLRESPRDRLHIFNLFEEALQADGQSFKVVKGVGESRFKSVMSYLK